MGDRLAEERRSAQATLDSREEINKERRKKEERRLMQAEREAEEAREREASARAQAAAASDVLHEQATELGEL